MPLCKVRYGAAMGLAFSGWMTSWTWWQTGHALGKTAGKDAASDKPTYVSLLGWSALSSTPQLLEQAHAAWPIVACLTRALAALADMVVRRSH